MNSIISKYVSIIKPTGRRLFGMSVTKFSSDQEIIHLPDNPNIKIPVYSASPNESIEKQRSRLVYQSRKRGMLENDLLLSTFASENLDKFTKQQLDDYDKLINTARNDWDIYYWIIGKEPTPKEFESDVIEMLKQHVKSNNGLRIRQPDLV